MMRWIRNGCVAAAVVLAIAGHASAADVPMELVWQNLIPAASAAAPKRKTFFSGSTPAHEGAPAPGSGGADARWMSSPAQSAGAAAPIVPELDGKTVRISGYIVPLDFDATKVKEFLLVPFVGACIHVPPPPANQIIFVKLSAGFEVGGTFDPVTVTGKLSAAQTFTGLAETGYSIDAETVQLRPK
jgi:uncharacterized protein